MTTVADLLPGDRITHRTPWGDRTYTFVGRISPHPLFPGLALVIWRGDQGEHGDSGRWSLDALSLRQHVGDAELLSPGERRDHLRGALLGDETS